MTTVVGRVLHGIIMAVSISLGVAASCLAFLVAALALRWNIVAWRRSGPRVRLETFHGVFRPDDKLQENVGDAGFQIIRVINGGRAAADIVDWGVRFLAPRGLRGRILRTKIVDYTGELPAPPHLPVRMEAFSEVHLHAWPIDRFVKFADAAGKGEASCKFQFYVRIAGQGEVATKLVDVSSYLFRWDGRGNPPRPSLKSRFELVWVEIVLLLKRNPHQACSSRRPAPDSG